MLSRVSYLNSRTRRKRKRETNIESVPDELLFDILVRLPADFLHDEAKLVCRRWCNIIHSHAFINAHLYSTYGLFLSSSANNDPHSIYVTASRGGGTEAFESMSYISMATSCNGLTLELRFDFNNLKALSLHVINHAILKSFRLPSVCDGNREVYRERCGIAYSAASMQYKVTLPYSSVDRGRVQYCLDILTVGVDKSWRHVEIPPLPPNVRLLFQLSPFSSEGFLHWVSTLGWFCLTMNVETEVITMSEAPIPSDQHYRYSYYYLSTGRYLSLLVGRRGELSWEVWEMKSGEWRKAGLPIIDLEAKKWWLLQQEFAVEEYNYECMFPVGWVKYPEVLAFCFSGLEQNYISYNLETHEINTIDIPYHPCHDYRAIVHRSSMVWLSQ